MKPLVDAWYAGHFWLILLWPFEWLFRCIVFMRRYYYQRLQQTCWQPTKPVIIIGNITVGGAGKTPFVASLVDSLQAFGWEPGIISRGYGGNAEQYPLMVTENTMSIHAGDEAVMLFQQTGCPVVVAPDRVAAAKYLLENTDCNIIVADDGLQHYALKRHIEVAIIDAERGIGNGHCLPAGPLREPISRLKTVDFVVVNGILQHHANNQTIKSAYFYELTPVRLVNLISQESIDLYDGYNKQASLLPIIGNKVHGIAGIGHPLRFFTSLRKIGVEVIEHNFADHYAYKANDFILNDELTVIMTAKDGVKFTELYRQERLKLDHNHYWCLQVVADIDQTVINEILQRLADK